MPCRYIYLLPLLTYMYLSEVHVLYDFWPEAAMLPWRTEPGPVAVELVRQYARVPPTSFHFEGSWQELAIEPAGNLHCIDLLGLLLQEASHCAFHSSPVAHVPIRPRYHRDKVQVQVVLLLLS